MIYWYDTEFIEDGKTIDLISIGIVAEDGREYYAQNRNAQFKEASDWVFRNVYPSLTHFHMKGNPDCDAAREAGDFLGNGSCHKAECSWRSRASIRDEVRLFCDPEKHGKPEFWGYYSAYDFVALCQMFGTAMDLPKGWPMYTRDLKQWCDMLGNPQLPKQESSEHHALADARWTKQAWEFLFGHEIKLKQEAEQKIVNAVDLQWQESNEINGYTE